MPKALVLACVFLAAIASTPPVAAKAGKGSARVTWSCLVPLLGDYKDGATSDTYVGEGVSYLYIGDKHLRSDYGADALFTAPMNGKRGWYDTALRLGPEAENNAFVQIEISRWRRFDYKQHVAVAWSVPHGSVNHQDTGLMLAEGVPHRLGIYVHDGLLRMFVDGRLLCSTSAANFVMATERKYFQVRTETSVSGSNGGSRVSNLRIKRDPDASPRAFATDCILHRNGIFWEHLGAGRFAARGAFYPNEGTSFTGIDPEMPCRA